MFRSMSAEDLVRIRHMVEAAREALGFSEGRSREDLFDNRMLFHSLVRNIEIIGEAASTVSLELRQSNPNFPWSDVIGMRNRLVHAYFDIDPDIVWETATQDLPSLLGALTVLSADKIK